MLQHRIVSWTQWTHGKRRRRSMCCVCGKWLDACCAAPKCTHHRETFSILRTVDGKVMCFVCRGFVTRDAQASRSKSIVVIGYKRPVIGYKHDWLSAISGTQLGVSAAFGKNRVLRAAYKTYRAQRDQAPQGSEEEGGKRKRKKRKGEKIKKIVKHSVHPEDQHQTTNIPPMRTYCYHAHERSRRCRRRHGEGSTVQGLASRSAARPRISTYVSWWRGR
jgi:hypothetical protein